MFPPDLCAANFNKHVLYFFLSFTNVSGEQNLEQEKKGGNLLDISFCFYIAPLMTPMGVLHLLLVSSRLCFLGCLWEHLWMQHPKKCGYTWSKNYTNIFVQRYLQKWKLMGCWYTLFSLIIDKLQQQVIVQNSGGVSAGSSHEKIKREKSCREV